MLRSETWLLDEPDAFGVAARRRNHGPARAGSSLLRGQLGKNKKFWEKNSTSSDPRATPSNHSSTTEEPICKLSQLHFSTFRENRGKLMLKITPMNFSYSLAMTFIHEGLSFFGNSTSESAGTYVEQNPLATWSCFYVWDLEPKF